MSTSGVNDQAFGVQWLKNIVEKTLNTSFSGRKDFDKRAVTNHLTDGVIKGYKPPDDDEELVIAKYGNFNWGRACGSNLVLFTSWKVGKLMHVVCNGHMA